MKSTTTLLLASAFSILLSAESIRACYDPSSQRWLSRDPVAEPGFIATHHAEPPKAERLQQPIRFGSLEDANLFLFIRNSPINSIDSVGLAPGYGNPVCGGAGPAGPSSPYAPGGYLYKPSPLGDCVNRCLAKSGAGWALAALGLASSTVGTIPCKPRGGALGSGHVTTAFSIAEHLGASGLREIGRKLNPIGTGIQVFAGTYLAGVVATCNSLCRNDPTSF